MCKPEIIAIDNGFAILTAKGADFVFRDEVSAVVVYKIDALTTDLICCDIVTGREDSEQIRTVHEEIPGFDDLMAFLETLPSFNRTWRETVVLPPFAEKRTILYTRRSNAL